MEKKGNRIQYSLYRERQKKGMFINRDFLNCMKYYYNN